MNKILLLVLGLMSFAAFGTAETLDYKSPQNLSVSNLQTVKKVTLGIIDASDGNITVGTHYLSNTHGQPWIPQGAVITDVYYRVKAHPITTSISNTISVGCATTTDLVTTVDPTTFATGSLKTGIPTGVPSSTGVLLAASCSPLLTVNGTAPGIIGGKLEFVFEYIPLD